MRELKGFIRGISKKIRFLSKNRFKPPKTSILGEGNTAKKFDFFRENLPAGATNLSRCASKRIFKKRLLLGRLKNCRKVVRYPFALELNSSSLICSKSRF